jgi:anaerobic selenocysteine-containing dehydrogenase
MDRRNFFKIVSTVSAGVATSACGSKTNQLIPLLVSDKEVVPGDEQWHAAVCTECGAGCGTLARVMAGERIVEQAGKQFRERIACVKKIEGNPDDAVSGGRLCARGHAALQGIYNPDRLRGPMMRTGERGKGEFKAVSWDEAIAAVAGKLGKAQGKILCLSRPEISARSETMAAFLRALGALPTRSAGFDGFALEQKAAEMVLGWRAMPVYDIASARYVLSIGADFLGGWVSPVYYARQFGQLRQGRSDIRGRLVQAESRMSLTAASADEWLPVRPGAEPQLAVALMRFLLDGKLSRHADALPTGTRESVESADLAGLVSATGIDERKLRRVAQELGESEGPLVLAGTSTVHSNSLDGLVAAHYLNLMLGVSAKPGAEIPLADGSTSEALQQARILLLDGENPVYTLGASLGDKDLIVSFSGFIDDSAAYADVILPDHHALEAEAAVMSPVTQTVAAGEQFVQPLYNTRALAQTLADIAVKLNVPFTGQNVKDFAAAHAALTPAVPRTSVANLRIQARPSQTAGTTEQFPFEFQPYLSLQYHDGRGANLPWMQELPDPASSAMWDLPAEIDPKTAAKFNIANGDRVRITSLKGSVEAFAYVHPAARPGVISMAIGQGHTHYGRYASGRGSNPLAILSPIWEEATGVPVTGGTRVRLERIGEGTSEFIQFSPLDREQGPWGRS